MRRGGWNEPYKRILSFDPVDLSRGGEYVFDIHGLPSPAHLFQILSNNDDLVLSRFMSTKGIDIYCIIVDSSGKTIYKEGGDVAIRWADIQDQHNAYSIAAPDPGPGSAEWHRLILQIDGHGLWDGNQVIVTPRLVWVRGFLE